ncbi:DUF4261 domain-containing protein [Sphingobium sp. CAP-1]|uniref:DUF4261 domain-containing protein n=1 Tax=Sphingobium sp. CAP-1 TaxID=2676077 RepID=UPI0012BB4364|nr:DUF4261 domain-containing protein [Sphingobium sp. CAP-1]QGP79673.1 DUF4261 domain-containing protein [Sphingobium sp. CAP-1]
MAIIVFTQTIPFPIAPLRQLLAAQLPLYKWQIGEADDGGARTMGQWSDHQLISGRTDATILFCELFARMEPLASDAPLHGWHLEIRRPTTDNDAIAHRVLLLIASVVMAADDGALCQLLPGGGWLSCEETARAAKALLAGETLEKIAQFGRPASSFAGSRAAAPSPPRREGRYAGLTPEQALNLGDMDETMARILHEQGMGDIADGMGLTRPPAFAHERPQPDRLPTMVLLAREPLILDWNQVAEGIRVIDPAGDWRVGETGVGNGLIHGRGATIRFDSGQGALPAYLLAQAQARSHGLSEEDRCIIASHRLHHSISIDLDTRAADFVAVRQTAKVATLLIGLAAKRPGCVGLFNAGVGTVMPVERVYSQVGILGSDEVPITLWTWAAFHSTQADAISISTGGMRPFTGYEVELWDAPGTLEQVAERLNGVLRYLLINGPAIRHGDTIGDHAGDRSTRCFLGDSRADRGRAPCLPCCWNLTHPMPSGPASIARSRPRSPLPRRRPARRAPRRSASGAARPAASAARGFNFPHACAIAG